MHLLELGVYVFVSATASSLIQQYNATASDASICVDCRGIAD